MNEIKVAIVDDHEVFVDSLSQALNNIDEIKVIFSTNSGNKIIAFCEMEEIPDVILLDISMPEIDGFKTCKTLVDIYPDVKVIALTGHRQKNYISKMIKSGASGYLLKSSKISAVIDAIKKAADGGLPFNNEAIQIMCNIYKDTDGYVLGKNDFSDREMEIIQLVCKELSTSEIAKKLYISESTVSTHKNHIFTKMKVRNTIGLAIYAFTHGLLE